MVVKSLARFNKQFNVKESVKILFAIAAIVGRIVEYGPLNWSTTARLIT